ncbi:hypothetical protein QEH56_21180 [Pelagicoccus enzymogenes]|uniref:hypothetical protein n=1 Tax=Pelagicoccus enzymogenes TaxID=2773457 RepID=UPI00280DDB9A|nr:hypothetical protein [Pelagicoccus enzymogenes]MDQ8200694.1 hypothetical protein [Pelagicoccus enzymogenes]
MKRFTETDKWKDAWFLDLSPEEKCIWMYLTDECDPAGVIEPCARILTALVGGDVDFDSFLQKAGAERIARLGCGKLWLAKFCDFQYPNGVSAKAKFHSKVRESVRKHALPIPIECPSNTHSIPKGNPFNGAQVKVEVEDKVEVKDSPSWKRLSKAEQARTKAPLEAVSESMRRIGALFNRRESTAWTVAEVLVWESTDPAPEEIDLICRFYELKDKQGDGPNLWKSDLTTLLNQWVQQLDRARSELAKRQPGTFEDPNGATRRGL